MNFKDNEKYMITIKGEQIADGKPEKVTLSTVGDFKSREDGRFLITYEESEATGFPGNTTTLEVKGQKQVTLLRLGPNNAQLVIEKGVRHLCHYETGYGSLMIGVNGMTVDNSLTEDGGEVSFSYKLDVNSSLLSINRMSITVAKRRI